MNSWCGIHQTRGESITCDDILIVAKRWPSLPEYAKNFAGMSPSWSNLGCSGCWDVIKPNVPCVDAGVGAFHKECYDKIVQYILETREAVKA